MFGAPADPTVAESIEHRSEAVRPSGAGVRTVAPAAGRDERLDRMIAEEIVPRLMVSHRAGALPPSLVSAVARQLSEADVASFVEAVRGPDDARASELVRELIADGTAVESVYLDLLAPTARRLGQLWDADECDFVEVTVALGRMQRLLRDLSQLFLADAGRAEPVGRVLLSCVPGEQHTLGIIMVGEFLLRDGWRVLVGAPWSETDLLDMVASEWYDVIGFSVGCESRLSVLKREIRRLRGASCNPGVQVMVGGQVFSLDASLVERVGADGFATDAREAPRVARSLLEASRRPPTPAERRAAASDRGQPSEAVQPQ
jgi:methanogenic corrinoid protein MtbC1